MPETLSSILSEPQRWAVPALLLVSAAGTPLVLWWERRRPSSYPGSAAHREALERAGVTSMDAWRRRSVEEQEAADSAALDRAEVAEVAAEGAVWEAERAAQAAVERAAAVNALYRP
jgi:hypothetical protein